MSYRPAICSHSLGRAWLHELSPKLLAASASGIPGIEIFFEDLIYLASSYPGGATPTNQILAARSIARTLSSLNLTIIAIGPFSNCEGLLCPIARKAKMEELKLWFEISHILGTDIIQIPCTFMTEGFTGDLETVARDLREIADLGAQQNPPFRFAFENLCFGTFFDTWDKAWAVVEKVDRPNIGMCLDTFNIAGRSWADPTSPTGKLPNADIDFIALLKRMARTMDPAKIFYVQVVDAERLQSPLDEKHEYHVDDQPPRMSWSRNYRLFMCEEERGGYLPVIEVLKTICGSREEGGLGYEGWISSELFNKTLVGEHDTVPEEHAERQMSSWRRLCGQMGWDDQEKVVEVKEVEHEKMGASFMPVLSRTKSKVAATEVVEIVARL